MVLLWFLYEGVPECGETGGEDCPLAAAYRYAPKEKGKRELALCVIRRIWIVGPTGLEPIMTEPKPVVLPLHHGPIAIPAAKLVLFYSTTKFFRRFFEGGGGRGGGEK